MRRLFGFLVGFILLQPQDSIASGEVQNNIVSACRGGWAITTALTGDEFLLGVYLSIFGGPPEYGWIDFWSPSYMNPNNRDSEQKAGCDSCLPELRTYNINYESSHFWVNFTVNKDGETCDGTPYPGEYHGQECEFKHLYRPRCFDM